MIELNKIDEIANRLRRYEQDDKPRYFNLYYTNANFPEKQQIAERISGETEFRNRVNEAINTYNAEKIIVEEFNQKSRNVKHPVNTVEIIVREKSHGYPAVILGNKTEQTPVREPQRGISILDEYGGLDGFKQEVRNEVAKEYQLLREQEEKKAIQEENTRLKKENEELEQDNTSLFEQNQELSEQVLELQKYVPENLKIANMSVTKVLGSIMGTAAETMMKNIVTRKPDKIKEFIGDTAFDQLAGILSDDETEEAELQEYVQELQTVPEPAKDDKHMQVANAIHKLNMQMESQELGKIQVLYYYFLNEDESINSEKLDELIQYINQQKEEHSSQ